MSRLFPLPSTFPDGPYADDFGGIIDNIRGLRNVEVFTTIGGTAPSLSTTSASFVDVGNTTGDFTKLGDETESSLIVLVTLSCFSSAINTMVNFGISLAGTDYDLFTQMINPLNEHTPMACFKVIPIPPVGQLSPKLRALRVSGSGTLQMTSDDYACYALVELPRS